MKTPLLVVVLLAIVGGAGYYGFQQYQQFQKAQAATVTQKLQAAQKGQTEAQAQALAKKQAADDATRQEINGALKLLKVSSIMPGQPGIVIIDKQEYAEGDDLPVAKRKLHVTKVQEDGVLLACNGLTFHLDPPAAPDLAASRKR